jgi:DNA polymerase alpha subunit B
MTDETLAELNQRFGSGTKDLEPDVVAELKSIMRLHQLSVQDLFFKWESYGMKMGMDDFVASIDNLRAFKQNLQDELERSNRTQQIKTEKRAGATPRAGKGGDVFGMLDGLATPGAGRAAKAVRRTPAVSRVKAEPTSSPLKVEEQPSAVGAIPYGAPLAPLWPLSRLTFAIRVARHPSRTDRTLAKCSKSSTTT